MHDEVNELKYPSHRNCQANQDQIKVSHIFVFSIVINQLLASDIDDKEKRGGGLEEGEDNRLLE